MKRSRLALLISSSLNCGVNSDIRGVRVRAMRCSDTGYGLADCRIWWVAMSGSTEVR